MDAAAWLRALAAVLDSPSCSVILGWDVAAAGRSGASHGASARAVKPAGAAVWFDGRRSRAAIFSERDELDYPVSSCF